jgi:hypothetical protein
MPYKINESSYKYSIYLKPILSNILENMLTDSEIMELCDLGSTFYDNRFLRSQIVLDYVFHHNRESINKVSIL